MKNNDNIPTVPDMPCVTRRKKTTLKFKITNKKRSDAGAYSIIHPESERFVSKP